MAGSAVFFYGQQNVNWHPCCVYPQEESSHNVDRTRKDTSTREETDSNYRSLISQKCENLKLNQTASEIIDASTRTSTKKTYKPYIEKWTNFAKDHNEDVLRPSIDLALNFLAKLFEEGYSFNAIVTAKCALANIFNLDNNIGFGSLPIVKKFLKGVYEKRPSLPYKSRMARWDPTVVLDMLEKSTISLRGCAQI